MLEDLLAMADAIAEVQERFVRTSDALLLPTEHKATFKRLTMEAKAIIDEALGPLSDFSFKLAELRENGNRLYGGPSFAAVGEAAEVIRGAANVIRRRETQPLKPQAGAKPYVDPARISKLAAIRNTQWDFSRLVELCRELNLAAANNCNMTVAMLVRTIVNHVPPILGQRTFAEVANNYRGASSFKKSMQNLQGSLRNIADLHLHEPIRAREALPTATGVNFAADVDVLLGEVARVADQKAP